MRKETFERYYAEDGTEFESEDECQAYESTCEMKAQWEKTAESLTEQIDRWLSISRPKDTEHYRGRLIRAILAWEKERFIEGKQRELPPAEINNEEPATAD